MNAVTSAIDGIGRPMNVVVRGNRGWLTRKSFLQPGEAITPTPPADVKRDHVVSIGAFIGIASNDASKDGEIAVALTGVHELPRAAAAVAQGDLADWTVRRSLPEGGRAMSRLVPSSCRPEAKPRHAGCG